MSQPTYRLPGPAGLHSRDDWTQFVSARVPGPIGMRPLDSRMSMNPASSSPGNLQPVAFPNIDRQDFIRTATERRTDPSQISQKGAPLCAPSALMYLMATFWPSRYFDFASQLYQFGEAKLGSLRIKPGADCRNFRPNGRIAAADWVTVASIRDSENTFWDVDDISSNWFGALLDGAAGLTLPSTLAGWMESMGFHDVRNSTNVYFTKDLDHFREAANLKAQGYGVCLFVRGNNLNTTNIVATDQSIVDREIRVESRNGFVQIFTIPNHWTVLDSRVNFAPPGGGLAFDIFTWGGRWHMKNWQGGVLASDDWLQNYYGYVAGKPGS